MKPYVFALPAVLGSCLLTASVAALEEETLTDAELQAVLDAQQQRIDTVNKVFGSVVAVYPESMGGGGSGVIYHRDGFALTNNHVVQPVGEKGYGGLADGKLYRLRVIGIDPGGDVALVHLQGRKDFPVSALGDSRLARQGDWTLAMGNPFTLAEDQKPTVTLGVISGVERYQYGNGNIGVYGNCIQTDTSMNPGNSGGPLFNSRGEVIGINGRISLEERGRVNVGLGYAISMEQVKNFLSDLRAAKVCQHGTLDAVFGDRSGRIICEQIDLDAPLAKLGLELGDELVSFDGLQLQSANQLANVLSTLPAGWPVSLTWRRAGELRSAWLRLPALPYINLRSRLQGEAGAIRDEKLNAAECARIFDRWQEFALAGVAKAKAPAGWRLQEVIFAGGQQIGKQELTIAADGRCLLTLTDGFADDERGNRIGFDGKSLWTQAAGSKERRLSDKKDLPAVLSWIPAWSALHAGQARSVFTKPVLEGGDRSQNVRADRLHVALPGEREARLWFSIWAVDGRFETRLLKIGPGGADTLDSGPQWSFQDWRRVGDCLLPHRRMLVTDLNETVRSEVRTESVTVLDELPENYFALSDLASTKDGEAKP